MAVKSSILVGSAFPTALPPRIWTMMMMMMMMHEVINFSYPPNSAATQNTALVASSRLQKRLSANPNWLRQPLFLRLPPQVDKRPHLHFWTVNRGGRGLSFRSRERKHRKKEKENSQPRRKSRRLGRKKVEMCGACGYFAKLWFKWGKSRLICERYENVIHQTTDPLEGGRGLCFGCAIPLPRSCVV